MCDFCIDTSGVEFYIEHDENSTKTASTSTDSSIGDLNSRLSKFIQSVKNEKFINELIEKKLQALKHEKYINNQEIKTKLNEKLSKERDTLNKLYLQLNCEQIKYRKYKTLSKWFENLFKFESKLNDKQKESKEELKRALNNKKNELESIRNAINNKIIEIDSLKSEHLKLTEKLQHLNDKYFKIKGENSNLVEYNANLRMQIDFYKKFSCKNSNTSQSNASDQNQHNLYKKFFTREFEKIKYKIRQDYEKFNANDLENYEDYLQIEFDNSLKNDSINYDSTMLSYDNKLDSLLGDVKCLNNDTNENLNEFNLVLIENENLNNRFLNVADSLLDFIKEPNENQSHRTDLILLKHSLNALNRKINSSQLDIKKFQVELNKCKQLLLKKNINFMLNEKLLTNFAAKSKNEFLQLCHTKSNLFSYLVFDYSYFGHDDFCLRITQNKFESTSLTIENSHKILDFDLSNWILRREIRYSIGYSNNDGFEFIDYCFPKKFIIKRRKKIILTMLKSKLGEKSKDTDVFLVNELSSWGCGAQIITKLINKKGIIKLVNLRVLKNIWIN